MNYEIDKANEILSLLMQARRLTADLQEMESIGEPMILLGRAILEINDAKEQILHYQREYEED